MAVISFGPSLLKSDFSRDDNSMGICPTRV